MGHKRIVICSIFGHEWEHRHLESYRSKSSLSQHLKRCVRCGKKQGAYSQEVEKRFSLSVQ